MTVSDLINALEKVECKDAEVYIGNNDDGNECYIMKIVHDFSTDTVEVVLDTL